ncbi:unnamed protein product [Camellia sinensis]
MEHVAKQEKQFACQGIQNMFIQVVKYWINRNSVDSKPVFVKLTIVPHCEVPNDCMLGFIG